MYERGPSGGLTSKSKVALMKRIIDDLVESVSDGIEITIHGGTLIGGVKVKDQYGDSHYLELTLKEPV